MVCWEQLLYFDLADMYVKELLESKYDPPHLGPPTADSSRVTVNLLLH